MIGQAQAFDRAAVEIAHLVMGEMLARNRQSELAGRAADQARGKGVDGGVADAGEIEIRHVQRKRLADGQRDTHGFVSCKLSRR
jgi:hypothetical protein